MLFLFIGLFVLCFISFQSSNHKPWVCLSLRGSLEKEINLPDDLPLVLCLLEEGYSLRYGSKLSHKRTAGFSRWCPFTLVGVQKT